ncbi:unnamed protein product [Phyllotreta striolata]|uniref:DUF4200 domain-containing protein n=1 Tax=Phyllotreta striolata TaxID=444603 RepID=A0A9N9TM68_PHYSR|nr:unnamed protein product [Phyllotreta striolata]
MDRLPAEAKQLIECLKPIERYFPTKEPHESCGVYLGSKQFTSGIPKGLSRKKFSFEDLSRRSAATNHHLVLKEYFEVENNLRIAREEAQEQRLLMKEEWKKLEERQEELRNTFQTFNNFMEQNENKRERSRKKLADTAILMKQKTEELKNLERLYNKMKIHKDLLDKANKHFAIYENFLSEVAKKDKINFETVEGVFNRYTALLNTRKDITRRCDNYIKEYETIRNKTHQLIVDKYEEIEGMQNAMTELQERSTRAQNEASKSENFLQKVYLEAQKKVEEIEYTKQSCWRIYSDICASKNRRPVHKNNAGKQLEVIKKYLRKMRLINRMVEVLEGENELPVEENETISDNIVANVIKTVSMPTKNVTFVK